MNGNPAEFSPLPKRSQRNKLHKQELKKQLRQFYGITEDANETASDSKQSDAHTRSISTSSSSSSLSVAQMHIMDFASPNFDAKAYLNKILQTSSLTALLKTTKTISQQIQNLDSSLQKLVYENYNKFLKATSVVEEMRTSVSNMESEMGKLEQSMVNMMESATKIEDALTSRSSNIQRLSGISVMLKKIQFVLDLPERISKCIELQTYEVAVKYYIAGKSILFQWMNRIKELNSNDEVETLGSFEKIWKETQEVIETLKTSILKKIDSLFGELKIVYEGRRKFNDLYLYELLDKNSLLNSDGSIDESNPKGKALKDLKFENGSIYEVALPKTKKSDYKKPDKRCKAYKDIAAILFDAEVEDSQIAEVALSREAEINLKLKENYVTLMKLSENDVHKLFSDFQTKYINILQIGSNFQDPWIHKLLSEINLLKSDGYIDETKSIGKALLDLSFENGDIYSIIIRKTKSSKFIEPDESSKAYKDIMKIIQENTLDIQCTPIHRLSQLFANFPISFFQTNIELLKGTEKFRSENLALALKNGQVIFEKFLEEAESTLCYCADYYSEIFSTDSASINQLLDCFLYFEKMISSLQHQLLLPISKNQFEVVKILSESKFKSSIDYSVKKNYEVTFSCIQKVLKKISDFKEIGSPSQAEPQEIPHFKQIAIERSTEMRDLVFNFCEVFQKIRTAMERPDSFFNAKLDDSSICEFYKLFNSQVITALSDYCLTYSTLNITDRDIRCTTTPDGAIIFSFLCQLLTLDDYSIHACFQTITKDSRLLSGSDWENKLNQLSYRNILYFIERHGSTLTEYVKIGMETPNWKHCDVPREVRDMTSSIADKLESISIFLNTEFNEDCNISESPTDSLTQSRGRSSLVYGRSTFSGFSRVNSQAFIDDLEHDVRKMFDKPTSFTIACPESRSEITATFILYEIWKIILKTIEESVRVTTFNKFGFQQMQLDLYYLQKCGEKQIPTKQQDLVSRIQEVLQSVASNSLEFELLDESILSNAIKL